MVPRLPPGDPLLTPDLNWIRSPAISLRSSRSRRNGGPIARVGMLHLRYWRGGQPHPRCSPHAPRRPSTTAPAPRAGPPHAGARRPIAASRDRPVPAISLTPSRAIAQFKSIRFWRQTIGSIPTAHTMAISLRLARRHSSSEARRGEQPAGGRSRPILRRRRPVPRRGRGRRRGSGAARAAGALAPGGPRGGAARPEARPGGRRRGRVRQGGRGSLGFTIMAVMAESSKFVIAPVQLSLEPVQNIAS